MWIMEGKIQRENVAAFGQDYRDSFPQDKNYVLYLKPLGYSSPDISSIMYR